MGQGFGLPVPHASVKPFTNLPREAIESLWTSYNLYGEGFGLDFNSLLSIFRGATYLVDNIGFTEQNLRSLFEVFDTDNNGLVDALELIILIALFSGMDTIDKINFAFNAYDFESTESLFFDEVTLLFRACARGLKKACPMQEVFSRVSTNEAESYAQLFFQSILKDSSNDKASYSEFRVFCGTHPVISSWLKMAAALRAESTNVCCTIGLDDMDVMSYREWPSYSVFESSFQLVKFKRAVAPHEVATNVTKEDMPVAVPKLVAPIEPAPEESSVESSELTPFREITAEEDEAIELAKAAEKAARNAVPPPPPPPLTWIGAADKGKPEEMPPLRKDAPQDTLTPLWVHGFGSSSAPRMKRACCYSNVGSIIYPASCRVLSLKKDEEGVWSQKIMSEHQYPITCMDIDVTGSLLATADRIQECDLFGETTISNTCAASINLWNLQTGAVRGSISVSPNAIGVRYVDFSVNGKMLLSLLDDEHNTINIYDTETLSLLFTKQIVDCGVTEKVLDIKFSGTNSIFAIAGTAGVAFYVDEGSSFMNPKGLRSYERRAGLYQQIGKLAESTVATVLSRFEYPDETVSGTATGQILLWRGRNCIQLLQAHSQSVSSLHYSVDSNSLVSGGKDGKINIYQVAAFGSSADGNLAPGPKLVQSRQLQVAINIDLMGQPGLISSSIRSVFLSSDKSKVLVSTFGGEIKELSCLAVDPNAAEEDAPPPPEEGAEVSGPVSNLGKDINGGSLVKVHYPKEFEPLSKDLAVSNIYQQFLPKSPIVSCLCKVAGGFLSGGGDGTVRQWAAAEGEAHRCVKVTNLDLGISLVTASNTLVAMAYDGISNLNKKGCVQVMTFPDMTYVAEIKAAPGEKVYDMKFAPEGNTLAIAAGNNKLVVYAEIESVWNMKGEITTLYPVLAFDFSTDGMFMRTADKDEELRSNFTLRYWDCSANFGKEVTSVEVIRGLSWNTNACPCAWDTKGYWNGLVELEPEYDTAAPELAAVKTSARGAEDPSAKTPFVPPPPKPPRVIRSIIPMNGLDRFGNLGIVGRRNGVASLHRLPAFEFIQDPVPASQVFQQLHHGRFAAILFIEEGSRLVTAGAADGIIQVWKVTFDTEEIELDPEDIPPKPAGEEEEEAPAEEEGEEGAVEVLVYDSADDEDLLDGRWMRSHLTVPKTTDDRLSAIRDWVPNVGVGVVGMGSKQGEHLLNATSGQPLPGIGDSSQLPSEELELDWVHGYSSRLSRASVRYNSEGHIVYPAATFGVIFDKVKSKQTLSVAHCEELTCLDVHPAGFAVSAHRGAGSIFACVWDSTSGKSLKRLDCGVVNGASAVAFNPGNADIFAIALQDDCHTIIIFNWRSGQQLARIRGSHKKTLCLSFSLSGLTPTPTSMDALGNTVGGDGDHRPCPRLLAGGVGQFKFIDRSVGSVFASKQGLYGAETKKSNCLCAAAVPVSGNVESAETEFLMGMSDGTLGVVPRGTGRLATFTSVLMNDAGVNSGSVTAIWVVKTKDPTVEEPAEYRVVIGATNGIVKVLDQELQAVNEWNLYTGKVDYGLAAFGKLRGFKSICVDKGNRKILYGTAGGEIGEIELVNGSDGNKGPVVTGHFRDKLYGICVHPFRQECVTSGDDKMVRIWDLTTHKQILSIALPDISRAVAYSPNGLIIAAGMGGVVAGANRPAIRECSGQIAIISYMQNELRIVYVATECKDDVNCLAFSPDGSKLYAGAADSVIYVFDAVNNFKHLETVARHTQPVKFLDVSADGNLLVSYGNVSEVIVWETSSMEVIQDDLSGCTFGQQWYSREGCFCIDNIGAFSQFGYSNDILASAFGKSKKLVAAGDYQGTVTLRRAPATCMFAPGKKYLGHTPGGVSRVAFTNQDTYLLSLGRDDRTMIQWKLKVFEPNTGQVVAFSVPSSHLVQPAKTVVAKEGNFDDSFTYQEVANLRGVVSAVDNARPLGLKLRSVVGIGSIPDSAGTVGPTPTLKAVYAGIGDIISCTGKVVTSLLDDHLTQKQWTPAPMTNLKRREGGLDSKPVSVFSAAITSTIQVVSCLIVSPDSKFLLVGGDGGHLMCLNANKELVANGVLAIFNATSGALLTLLADNIPGGVADVCFSPDGLFCAALAADALHTVYLYSTVNNSLDWADGELHCAFPTSRKITSLIAFMVKTGAAGEYDLVSAGEGLPTYYTVSGRNVAITPGSMAEMASVYPTTAMVSLSRPQSIATGDSAGCLWVSENGVRMKQMFGFHTGPISALASFAIPCTDKSYGVVSGSIDCVKLWDLATGSALKEFSIQSMLASVNRAAYLSAIPTLGDTRQIKSILAGECATGYVSSVCVDFVFRRLLVTLSTGMILEVAHDSGSTVLIADGGYGKVHAIAAHPREPNILATAGEDKLLKLWNIHPTASQTAHVISDMQIPHPITSLAWIGDDKLAVGVVGGDTDGNSGSVYIIKVASAKEKPPLPQESVSGELFGKHLMERAMSVDSKLSNVGRGSINMLRCSLALTDVDMSPVKLAACSDDGAVYVYEFLGGITTFSGSIVASPTNRYPIAGADFSCNGRYLRTFSKTIPNAAIDVRYFDFQQEASASGKSNGVAGEVAASRIDDVLTISWASISSAATPEADWTMRRQKTGLSSEAVPLYFSCSPLEPAEERQLVAAGYSDGSFAVYRAPVVSHQVPNVVGPHLHAEKPVMVTFMAGGSTLCTVSSVDGSVLLWDVFQ